MKGETTKLLAFCLILLAPSVALAVPLTWDLQNVKFIGSSSPFFRVTGSYTYDADTNIYTDINIMTQIPGTGNPVYSDLNTNFTNNATGFVVLPDSSISDLTGTNVLSLRFLPAMTNFGGQIQVTDGFQALCRDPICQSPQLTGAQIRPGSIISAIPPSTTSPIPEPSTLLLFGTGLVVMILYVWRRERLHQS